MDTPRLITGRNPQQLETDKAALCALAQAAINVELFTIPLYMTSMYSIQGMHEINAADQTFYQGRLWPGAATTSHPKTDNERAFNVIFSVFIQEMLHLQLAANLATSMGVQPCFTELQDKKYGWLCYGPEQTIIPHIIDLRDTTTYSDLKVALRPLDLNQIRLFLCIEEKYSDAESHIKPDKRAKYAPKVPFENWSPGKPLPLFGSIGNMYKCMAEYMALRYDDGSTLWSKVYTAGRLQQDLFNTTSTGHPMSEYPGFPAVVPTGSMLETFFAAIDLIDAITDQGEGAKIGPVLRETLLQAQGLKYNKVEQQYQSSPRALAYDYRSYDAAGHSVPSRDAAARYPNDTRDHFERFREVELMLKDRKIKTWEQWHAERGPKPWTAKDLLTGSTDQASNKIPSAQAVADALNRLQAQNVDGSVFKTLSNVAAGAIGGVTSVLNDYWKDPSVAFPFPSMGGSGDRMAICFAILGKAPDLALGTELPVDGKLYHACQGLDLSQPGKDVMPAVATFHTCKGSNGCKGQGGCGFVQSVSGGGSCSAGGSGCGKSVRAQVSYADGTEYSAPSDNKCAQFGGCAVPISASQLFPTEGTMQLFDIRVDPSKPLTKLKFGYGDTVYDTAWRAYCEVLKSTGAPAPAKPPLPNDLRVALPPST